MIILREAAGLARLGRLGRLRHEADAAALEGDKALALDVVSAARSASITGARTSPGVSARLAEHEGRHHGCAPSCCSFPSARSSRRSIRSRRSIVATSAKRVSVVTAVSPGALIDMLFVASENLRMLRRLATLYGARPGTLSLLKLARMVVTHIVLTGASRSATT